MSSMEIARLCNKRHDNVMRDIQVTLAQAGIDAPKFGGIYLDANNRQKPCYFLPRFECDIVVGGYSVPYRAACFRRWHELEAKLIADSGPPSPPATALSGDSIPALQQSRGATRDAHPRPPVTGWKATASQEPAEGRNHHRDG